MKQARSRIGFARAGTLVAVAALAIVMACEARIPTAADVDQMDVAALEKVALNSRIAKRSVNDTVRFFVNDLQVTEEEAKNLSAKQIATVNIAKSAKGHLKEFRIMLDSSAGLLPSKVAAVRADGIPLAPSTAPKGVIMLDKTPRTGPAPLVYIDGKESSEAGMAALPTSAIMSVEVVKGETARRLYGNRGAEVGVISVKTKAP